jgi:hypothetical protein
MRPACKTGDSCPAFASFVQYGGRRWRSEAREPGRESGAALGLRVEAHLVSMQSIRNGATD